jgi:hypothetical protein
MSRLFKVSSVTVHVEPARMRDFKKPNDFLVNIRGGSVVIDNRIWKSVPAEKIRTIIKVESVAVQILAQTNNAFYMKEVAGRKSIWMARDVWTNPDLAPYLRRLDPQTMKEVGAIFNGCIDVNPAKKYNIKPTINRIAREVIFKHLAKMLMHILDMGREHRPKFVITNPYPWFPHIITSPEQ